jgi:hypothetical protein
MTSDCGNYVQVIEVTPPGQADNRYCQCLRSVAGGTRQVQRANWDAIAQSARMIVMGDVNAHSTVWNGRATGRRNAGFGEKLTEDKVLVEWNTEDAAKLAGTNHSIIDLTLSSPNLELNWSIAEEKDATVSDHEVLVWEALGERAVGGARKDTTGWDDGG